MSLFLSIAIAAQSTATPTFMAVPGQDAVDAYEMCVVSKAIEQKNATGPIEQLVQIALDSCEAKLEPAAELIRNGGSIYGNGKPPREGPRGRRVPVKRIKGHLQDMSRQRATYLLDGTLDSAEVVINEKAEPSAEEAATFVYTQCISDQIRLTERKSEPVEQFVEQALARCEETLESTAAALHEKKFGGEQKSAQQLREMIDRMKSQWREAGRVYATAKLSNSGSEPMNGPQTVTVVSGD